MPHVRRARAAALQRVNMVYVSDCDDGDDDDGDNVRDQPVKLYHFGGAWLGAEDEEVERVA